MKSDMLITISLNPFISCNVHCLTSRLEMYTVEAISQSEALFAYFRISQGMTKFVTFHCVFHVTYKIQIIFGLFNSKRESSKGL